MTAAATTPDPKKEEPSLPDADPEGVEHLKTVDPIAAMNRLVLAANRSHVLPLLLAEFDVAIRSSTSASPFLPHHRVLRSPLFRRTTASRPASSCPSAKA